MSVKVVGGWDEEIVRGWGFGPAKPKTKHNSLSISLVLRQTVWVVVGTCRVRGKG